MSNAKPLTDTEISVMREANYISGPVDRVLATIDEARAEIDALRAELAAERDEVELKRLAMEGRNEIAEANDDLLRLLANDGGMPYPCNLCTTRDVPSGKPGYAVLYQSSEDYERVVSWGDTALDALRKAAEKGFKPNEHE
jgi:hypothetical protein